MSKTATVSTTGRVGVLKARAAANKLQKLTVEVTPRTYKRLEARIKGNKQGSKSALTEQALISLLDTLDAMEALTNE